MSHDLLIAFLTAGLAAAGWVVIATQKNTLAIVELTFHLKELAKKVDVIPKLERDVNAIHVWKRNMKSHLDETGEIA